MNDKRLLKSTLLGAALIATTAMTEPSKEILKPINFASIPGWTADSHDKALQSFRLSCAEILAEGRGFERPVEFGGKRSHWIPVCENAKSATDAKAFFETNFTALRVSDPQRPEGLFTGYYEPEAEGSLQRSEDFSVPIYARPPDLVVFNRLQEAKTGLKYGRIVKGAAQPYFTRRKIEEGALAGRGLEIVWLKNWADAFFIHIQGSGRVRLADGSLMRLAFAAKSGHPYTGVGGLLVERGIFPREAMSMQAIRFWMANKPEAARLLMWENRSFIFFQAEAVDDPAMGPRGAQKVRLTPGRSMAVDRHHWMFGTPVWLDTSIPQPGAATVRPFRQLMIAQDTGTAIRGHARGDVFWGVGEEAAFTAGQMKSPGSMIVLLPVELANLLLESK